jgi:hypothetical protein
MTFGRRRAALMATVLMGAGCLPAEPSSEPAPSASSPSPTLSASVAPSPPGPAVEPPKAFLGAEGDPGVAGDLGTYTFGGTGDDSPWLPGEPMVVPAGVPLAIRFDPPVEIGDWIVRITEAADFEGRNAAPYRAGSGPVTFVSPSAGAWSIAVSATFANGVGDATFYWRLSVEEP